MAIPIAELKNRLKEAMSYMNMRPIELSQKTNIPKSSISQYMSGHVKPNSERVYLISKALNVSEAWLLGYDVPKEEKIKNANSSIFKKYNQLNDLGKKKADDYIDDLSTNPKYIDKIIYDSIDDEEDYRSAPFIAAQGGGINQSGKNLTIDEIKELNRLADEGDDGIIE